MGTEADVEAQRAAVDLLRRRVLNVVGHELRTPVTTLRGLAELLGTYDDGADEAELHDAIRRTARRIEALLDDLLLATGVTTAVPVGPAVALGVAATVQDAWTDLGEVTGDTDVTVSGDAVVLAEPEALRRSLDAVLDNAARHGEAPVEVQVSTTVDAVVVVVADRGPGVPVAELGLVTEPFFRGERAVMRHHSLGLGLAVTRSLTEHHDGAIEVRNRTGGGFEVELRFPPG